MLNQRDRWKSSGRGTGVFTVSTHALVAEATNRVEDFSSNIECLLYRDDTGLPCRISFGGDGIQVLATAEPPVHPVHRHEELSLEVRPA